MKILHLVSEKHAHLTRWVYNLRDKKEQGIEHSVLALRNQNQKSFSMLHSDICSVDLNYYPAIAAFVEFIESFDKIILHSILFPSKMQLIMLLRFPSTIKKMYWTAYGFDLYEISKERGIRGWLKWKIQMMFRKKIPNFISIFPPDGDFYKSLFGCRNRIFYAPYGLGEEVIEGINTNLDNVHETNKPYVIQVGHSSSKILNHNKILKMLSAYKEENIIIYLTLAYGDRQYADSVVQCALSIFGEQKVFVQDLLLPPAEYNERIKNFDIGIFDTPRQQALGNITRLLRANKKVYLMRDSILYKFFTDLKVPIVATDEIGILPFDDFSASVHSCTDEFMDFLRKRREDFVCGWDAVFNAPNV